MRLKACKEIGLKEIPVILADEWTEEQKAEFLVKDNVGFGEWDWDVLANEWNAELLNDWGLYVPEIPSEVDYSILDDEDLDGELNDMADGVKKAIQIEFQAEHYEEAAELVKFWRDKEAYLGGMIMEYLKAERYKL
jgi:ParB-like chromosome segregation protein Spo0J